MPFLPPPRRSLWSLYFLSYVILQIAQIKDFHDFRPVHMNVI